jgi:hypothetical protein
LQAHGHAVRAVSTRTPPAPEAFAGCDAVVHLAGEKVAQRWTRDVRQRIVSSRVDGTRAVVAAFDANPPKVLVCSSAVGYYGARGDQALDEAATPGSGFLAEVAQAWEKEALAAEALDVRVVRLRTGIALGPEGGALKEMLLPFRLGLGGPIAGGRHWMPWIHADDVAALVEFALDHPTLAGPVNAVAPNPVTNSEFTRALERALHRPALLPVPGFALKLLFGEMSQILMESQRVIPRAALDAGFVFRFPELRAALADLLSK